MTQTVGFIDKFGEDPTVGTSAFVDIRGGNVNKVYLTSAETMTIVSDDSLDDAGNAAGNAHKMVIQGLDANWVEASEEITLDGQTPVVTTSTWMRVNRMYITDIGTAAEGTNKGLITCTQTTSGNLECEILALEGQSFDAEWTVPLNQIAKVKYYWTNIGKGDDAIIRFETRENGKAWRTRAEVKIFENEIRHDFGASITVPAKGDIKVVGKAVTAQSAISAGFFLEQIDVSGSPTPAAPQA
jgi:hypothetical protein